MPSSCTLGPLPEESSFVAQSRDTLPQSNTRVTTATNIARGRGRGRGRVTNDSTEETSSRSRGRGTRRPRQVEAGTSGDQQRGRGRARARRSSYNRGRRSAHYLLFGDDEEPTTGTAIPPEIEEEIPITQNAPAGDNI